MRFPCVDRESEPEGLAIEGMEMNKARLSIRKGKRGNELLGFGA